VSRTVVVIGAGPGLGMGVARSFGRHGFRVGLVARGEAGLRERVAELAGLGVEAAYAPADVRNPAALTAALDVLADRLGPPDVVEYGPDPRGAAVTSAARTTPESATGQFELIVRGALVAAGHVLPGMTDRGRGAFLVTVGASATVAMPVLGSVGIAMAGIRNWVHAAHPALAERGVHLGTLTIATSVRPGTEGDPDAIGQRYYRMYLDHAPVEDVVGDLDAVRALVAASRNG